MAKANRTKDKVEQPELEGMPPAPVTLIGFGHKAQSGKDTAAEILVAEYGWVQLGFSDALKELALFVNPVVEGHNHRMDSTFRRQGFTWEELKRIPEVRRFLQFLGEGARQILGQDVWVDALRRRLIPLGEDGIVPGIVITDMRYPNEARMIQELGGTTVRVDREGAGAGNYISETALDGFDYDVVFDNNHSKGLLWDQVEALIGAIDEDELQSRIDAYVQAQSDEADSEG